MLCSKIQPTAIIPTRGSASAAGYDLYAHVTSGFTMRNDTNGYLFDKTIPTGFRALIPTGIKIAIEEGKYARIAPRSGLAWNNGVDVFAGVVDSDYRGEVMVCLYNTGPPLTINTGDRIAQLIIETCHTPQIQEVETLPTTLRDAGGFGSTGV